MAACGGNDSNSTRTQAEVKETTVTKETTAVQVTTEAEKKETKVEDNRPQRNGIDDYFLVTEDIYEFQVPSYWGKSVSGDHYQGYAETDGKVAMLEIRVQEGSNGSVKADMFDTGENRAAVMESVLGGMRKTGQAENDKIISSEIIETDTFRGALWEYRIDIQGMGLQAHYLMIPDEENNCLVMVNCGCTDNTDYRYDDDFKKMINQVHKAGVQENNVGEVKETIDAEKQTVQETSVETMLNEVETEAETVPETKIEAKETKSDTSTEVYDIDKDLTVVMCETSKKHKTMYNIVFAEMDDKGNPKNYYTFEDPVNPRDMGKQFNAIGPLPSWFYVGAVVHVKANTRNGALKSYKCSVTPATDR